MWRKDSSEANFCEKPNQTDDFSGLLRYINYLAHHKLGYPVSLLTYLGVVNNKVLGIQPGSLANILLNNVGDPFKDSETSLLEVKKHEREVIAILEKYYGLKENEVRGYVTTGGTEGNFAALWWSKRFLINSAVDNLIEKDNEIKLQMKEEQELLTLLPRIPINDYENRNINLQKIIDLKNKISENKNIIQQIIIPTVFYSKEHTHYSIGKIAEVLRLNIKGVKANQDGSIDLNNLKKEILLNLKAFPHSPVIVIANIGTTVTGAIDDVPGIRKILMEVKPSHFTIHLDGALTGFVMPIIKPFGDVANYFDAIGASTLAVSAHKFPGLSQPCGIVLAKREFFEKAFEKSERNIDYVGNILDVTITGSRSGLNVLMFYNALHSLGLHKNNNFLIKMVEQNFENAKYLHKKLVEIFGNDRVLYPYHFNVIFPKPSAKLAKKYQLMVTGERATICVLTNVSKGLIDQFIEDLKLDIKEMNMSTEKTDYRIIPLTDEYLKPTIDLFVKTFCDSEPITKKLGVSHADYEPFAREVIQKAVKEGLSKIAIDPQNKVIACCIAEDLADPFIPKPTHYQKLKPIFALIAELSKSFFRNRKFVKGKVIHVWIAMVDNAHRGQGLSTEVDMAAIETAARKGYDFAYAEFTNELSEKVTHQFNVIKLLTRIQYEDFKFENTLPFKGLKGSASNYVATIRPGVKLSSLEHCYSVEEKY